MIEIRIHGRGGQGAVIASKLLACAVFMEGRFVQSFPAFGVERRGAPVTAFLRVDDRFIYVRTGIISPDHVVVLDQRLMASTPVTGGLKAGGIVLINSASPPGGFSGLKDFSVHTVDANTIARVHGLGSPTSPIVNTVMCGAFLRISRLAGMKSLEAAIREEVHGKPEANTAAASEAYEKVR
jgi:pyruvate ferredoxin oxidoreductase gamma subunit/2-oxoisovalerate ferredoxin oxidoreductase gamma subunit